MSNPRGVFDEVNLDLSRGRGKICGSCRPRAYPTNPSPYCVSSESLHRISAATCHRNTGQFFQAANLFQGALAGPLNDATRADVEQFLDECLAELGTASPSRSAVVVSW